MQEEVVEAVLKPDPYSVSMSMGEEVMASWLSTTREEPSVSTSCGTNCCRAVLSVGQPCRSRRLASVRGAEGPLGIGARCAGARATVVRIVSAVRSGEGALLTWSRRLAAPPKNVRRTAPATATECECGFEVAAVRLTMGQVNTLLSTAPVRGE